MRKLFAILSAIIAGGLGVALVSATPAVQGYAVN
jgi:hypothetical protein